MNTSKNKEIIRNLLFNDYDQTKRYIIEHIDDSLYESFMAQKCLKKLYLSDNLTDNQKAELLQCLINSFQYHKQEVQFCYDFIQIFCPIAHKIYYDIENSIKSNFGGSLFVFSYCLGLYAQKNPETIGTVKNLLFSIAKNTLNDDLHTSAIKSKLVLAESIYNKYEEIIESIYLKAVKYGVISEKYDAISFCREKIKHISIQYNTPTLYLFLSNPSFELELQRGVDYNRYLADIRKDKEESYIYSYYKCKICKYCFLNGVSDENKEYAIELLKRQYSQMNITDILYFLTGDMPSYIFSIISLFYTELLKLILLDNNNYIVLNKEEIKKQMLWGNSISEDDFDLCFSLIRKRESCQGYFLPINNENAILIGKWMFDWNLSIVESAKEVAFNSSKVSRLGQGTNFFGKDVFETIVRTQINDLGWKTVKSSMKLKQNKKIVTDVDLIAYRNGIVIIGQLKVAHCGRNDYQIWKVKRLLGQAVNQVRRSVQLLDEDNNRLYSTLKRESIVAKKEEIKTIIPIVVTSSNYFIGLADEFNVTVVSLDMLYEMLWYVQDDPNNELTLRILKDPMSLYSFGTPMDKVISEIDQNEFHIFYEEYEHRHNL